MPTDSSGHSSAKETLLPPMPKRRRRYVWIWACCECGKFSVSRESPIHEAWTLDQHELSLSSSPARLCDDDSDSEAVFGEYHRKNVHKKHLEPGGKYRAVCKLFITFENATKQATKQATGWCCIENDLIATAGHCVFDEEYGRAKAIEVHVGYHGSHSDVRKSHEVRKAVCVAVHRDWYNGYHRPNDLAMIRLQHPFDQMFPLGLKHCPLKADITTVQVVGYPMDVPGGMEGHFMYKSIGPARWGLEENSMLIYRLDTAKGSSGSPVVMLGEDREPVVIGIHVCTDKIPRPRVDDHASPGTGRLYRVNKAVAIGHKGNKLVELQRAITLQM